MCTRLVILKFEFLFSTQVAIDDIISSFDWKDCRLDWLTSLNLALDACCIIDVEYSIILQDRDKMLFGGQDFGFFAVLILSLFLAVRNHREENNHR